MQDNEKYYTPQIEEFHLGFRYEYLDLNNTWIIRIVNYTLDLEWLRTRTEQGKIRVKKLDQADIEQLGWALQIKNRHQQTYLKELAKLKVLVREERIFIDVKYIQDGIPYKAFRGKIKNISELKNQMERCQIS